MALIAGGSSTQTTPSVSPSPEMCPECQKEIKDYDPVVAVVSGVYWKPPTERVRVQSTPLIYHEDCYYTEETVKEGDK